MTTDPIPLLVECSKCLCTAEDIPCLKHHRVAFSVWFAAKYGCDPLGERVNSTWYPFYTDKHGWPEELLARLELPGYLHHGDTHWSAQDLCPKLYSQSCSSLDGGRSTIRGKDLAEVLTRFKKRFR